MPGLNDALDRFMVKALACNLPVTFVNHAMAPHAFDLFHDSDVSRETIRRILAFLQFHLLLQRGVGVRVDCPQARWTVNSPFVSGSPGIYAVAIRANVGSRLADPSPRVENSLGSSARDALCQRSGRIQLFRFDGRNRQERADFARNRDAWVEY
jgi:hypothetical protein